MSLLAQIVTVTLQSREKVECHINSYSPYVAATFYDPAEQAEIDFDHAFCNGVDLTCVWDMLDKDVQKEIEELAIKAVEDKDNE
jgi:hypothetical protein